MHDDDIDIDVDRIADKVCDLAQLIAMSIHNEGSVPLELIKELASSTMLLTVVVPR